MRFRRPKKVSEIQKEKKNKRKESQNQGPFLSTGLDDNLRYLREGIGRSSDIVFREYTLDLPEPVDIVIVFVDGMISREVINEYILEALSFEGALNARWAYDRSNLILRIRDHALSINEVSIQTDLSEITTKILSGETAILFEGYAEAIICNTRGWEHRGIDEPDTEAVIRGPRVGFNEILRSNTAQIRRWIRDPDLMIKSHRIGRRTKSDVAVVYLHSVANPRIIAQVEKRLKKIDVDGVIESSYLQEMIEDRTLTLFPTVHTTERVDRVVAAILEGKVAILTDNTPFVLIVPVTFWQLYSSAEDYYHRWPMAILLRSIRFISFFFSLYLPSIYIAFSIYSPELIPFDLAVKMAGSREGVPFPVLLEAILMELSIEIIREASARLPGPLGQTIGIVGGFVLGDAAVRAGLISPVTTVVVAFTAISSFTSPSYDVAVSMRILRFPFMLVALVGGLYGLSMSTILLLIHLAGIRSFGVPFLAPFVPLELSDLKDSLFVAPRWAMVTRPKFLAPLDQKRQKAPTKKWWSILFSPSKYRGREEEEEGDD